MDFDLRQMTGKVLKRLLGVCIVLAAVAFPASGAVAIVQHVKNHLYSWGTTISCTLSSTGASRNIIVGAVSTAEVVSVSSVTDNQSNTYVQASGSSAVGNAHAVAIWHSLGTTAGVTSVTITFSAPPNTSCSLVACGTYKACFAYEVSGSLTFDVAGKIDSATCTSNICQGASVTTATSTGFVLGVTATGNAPVDQNPNSGNEFTSGGDIDDFGNGVSAALISGTAAAHQPAWHNYWPDRAGTFTSSTAAYKQ
jgi:hypothetical protein